MKKLTLIFAALTLAIAAAAGIILTACDNAEKLDYTVTVLSCDETGMPDVTVKWSDSGVKGAAVTDENGTATASISAGTYEVTLENLPAGFSYTPASVTSSLRKITITLEKIKIDYTVTVNQFDGKPAVNVSVNWWADDTSKADAITGDDGKASTKLDYGDYSVTITNLPENNFYIGSADVTGANPDAVFNLESGDTINYSVTVKSEGGLKFKDYTVSAYNGTAVAATAKTDDNGVAAFTLPSDLSYSVRVSNVPNGYTYSPVNISKQNPSVEIALRSEVIATLDNSARYLVGDIIHDYTFTTPYKVDGKNVDYKISEILKNKDAIVINFWGTNCSACMQEMPAMQQAYEIYSENVEFLAVSNYMGGDSNSAIEDFRKNNSYTFPMFRDTHSFTSKFALGAWPTNVIIDRYGAIARIEEGALTSLSFWQKLLDQYVGDDYVQTFTPGLNRNDSTVIEMAKPDVKVDADHYEKVAAAINNQSSLPDGCSIVWYGEPEATAEFTWPFILKDLDGGRTVLYPSNADHDNTYSFIYADVTMTAGKVLAFDYWAQTETDCDIFYVLIDGKVIYKISGENADWKTCYVYVDILKGTHHLALSYVKDESRGAGFDNVYISNVRFTEISEITDATDVLRGAAYGVPAEGENKFPHYAAVEKHGDGYYYVDLSKLSGTEYAGDDSYPMLFVNLTQATNWNKLSVGAIISEADETTGEYKNDCTFEFGGAVGDQRKLISSYVSLADKSDINGYLPVDETLKNLLTAFTAHFSGDKAHADEWLELCYFFSHYGGGKPYGNPIIGLTKDTAIEMNEGTTYTADLTRNIAPYPISIYSFTPEKNGVYNVKSFIPENKASIYSAQIWVYTEDTDHALLYSGDNRMNRDGANEQNFDSYLYLTAGNKYYISVAFLMTERGMLDFSIAYVGESAKSLVPCASGTYDADENNNLSLSYAVDYKKDDDGFYHAINSDGTEGDFIYLDFKYETLGYVYYPLSVMINQKIADPQTGELLFKVFDFTQAISYIPYSYDEDGNVIYNYEIIALSPRGEKFRDYTDVMQAYCDEAMKNNGWIKINDELVELLTMFHKLRTETIYSGILPEPVKDEWLKFCWYYKVIDANNPV